jgi:hypothetical protein
MGQRDLVGRDGVWIGACVWSVPAARCNWCALAARARSRSDSRERCVPVDIVDRLVENVAADLPAGELETQIMFGDPADALDSLCRDREAALLVVGTRGRSGLAVALCVSLSTRLARRGECPVVVVSPDAAEQFLSSLRRGGTVVLAQVADSEAAQRSIAA